MLVGYYPINRGGAEYQSYLLAQELRKTYDVFFISIGQRQDTVIHDDGFRIYALPIPWRGKAIFRLMPRLLSILRAEAPDYIYQRVGCAATGIAAYYGARSAASVIWHIASQADLEEPKTTLRSILNLDYFDRKALNYGISRVDHIIAQASYQQNLLLERFGRTCAAIIPNFHPQPTGPLSRSAKVQVVWLANIKAWKRPQLFLQLAEALRDRTDVQFVMAGRAGDPLLTKQVRDYERRDANFSYRGELSRVEVDALLCQSHLLVNTSEFEGFPNSFIEAWFRQVPTVSLSVNPDGVLDDRSIGLHSETMTQLVADVETLLDHAKLREQMGRSAASHALKQHSLKNITAFQSLLQRLYPKHRVVSS